MSNFNTSNRYPDDTASVNDVWEENGAIPRTRKTDVGSDRPPSPRHSTTFGTRRTPRTASVVVEPDSSGRVVFSMNIARELRRLSNLDRNRIPRDVETSADSEPIWSDPSIVPTG